MSPTTAAAARGLLIAHLLLSPLIFSGATLEAFETNKAALLALTAVSLMALGGASVRIGRPAATWLREPVTLAVLAFAASAAVSTACSITPLTSFYGAPESCSGFVTVAAYAVLFLATRALCATPGDARRLLAATAIATSVSAVFGLLQALSVDPFVWADASHVSGIVRPFAGQGHANFLGAYLVTALPAVVMLGIWAYERGHRTTAAILALVATAAVVATVATLSRGAWLALGTTALAAAAIGRARVRARWWVVLAVCVAAAAIAFRGGVAARLQNLGDAAGRFDLWRAGLEMYRDHPLTGVGLDGYQTAFGRYRPVAFWKVEWNTTPNKAHNEFVHVLATQGTLGGLAAIALVAALAVAARRGWRRTDAATRLLVVAAGLGAFAFLVQGLFSFTVAGVGPLFVTLAAVLARCGEGFDADDAPAPEWRIALAAGLASVGLVFIADAATVGVASGWKLGAFAAAMTLAAVWTACALAGPLGGPAAPVARHVAPRRPWRFVQLATVAGCAAVAWFVIAVPYRADRLCREAENHLDADPIAASALYEKAVELAPSHDLYWARLASACRHVETHPESAEQRQTYGRRARAAAERAVRLAPLLAHRHALLGQVLGDLAFDGLARPDEALAAYDAALALDPRNAAILAEAGRAAWGLGRFDTARAYLKRGLDLDPTQANLTALSGSVAMAEGHFEEADACFRDARELDWHGDEDARLHALAAWGACLARLNRPIEAESWLRYVLDRRPDWVPPRYTLAFALTLSGRPAAAEFRTVIEKAPNHPLAAESRRWLDRLEMKSQ